MVMLRIGGGGVALRGVLVALFHFIVTTISFSAARSFLRVLFSSVRGTSRACMWFVITFLILTARLFVVLMSFLFASMSSLILAMFCCNGLMMSLICSVVVL